MTFAEMYGEVQSYLPESGIDATTAKKYVNRAYLQMAMSFQFYGVETKTTFNTAAADNDYDIGTVAVGAKDIVAIYNNTQDYPLVQRDIVWWEATLEDPTTVTGEPTDWVRYGDDILLYPTPDAIYEMNIRYKTNPAEMTTDGESPVFPEEWHEAIVLSAMSKAAFFYGFDNKGINMKNEALALISALQEEPTMASRRRIGQISVQRLGHTRQQRRRRHPEFD